MRATNFSALFLRFKDGYGMHAGIARVTARRDGCVRLPETMAKHSEAARKSSTSESSSAVCYHAKGLNTLTLAFWKSRTLRVTTVRS